MSNEIERYVLKPEEIPDRLKIHAVAKPGHAKPQWGDIRFKCECGWYIPNGGTAIIHSFDGHQVVEEKFAGGRWVYSRTRETVAQQIIRRLRERGESVSAFTKRLNERMDELERIKEGQQVWDRENGLTK